MKRFIMLSMVFFLGTFMSACSRENENTQLNVTKVTFEKDGSVTSSIVEDFDKEYYKVEDLTDMINETISDFCRKKPGATISLENNVFDAENKKINTVIKYDSAKTYAEFNNVDMFYGTVKEAYEAGYDMNTTLHSAIDSNKYPDIKKQDILNMNDYFIIIMDENIRVESNLNISYVSNGVDVVNKKTADMNQDSKLGMIILNK